MWNARYIYEQSHSHQVEVHFPNADPPTHYVISDVRQSSNENDVALLIIESPDEPARALQPILLDLPAERWWMSWKKLFVVGFSQRREIIHSKLPYSPRIVKCISSMIKKKTIGDVVDLWRDFSPAHRERLVDRARKQLDLIVEFDNDVDNVLDRDEAKIVLRKIVDGAKENCNGEDAMRKTIKKDISNIDTPQQQRKIKYELFIQVNPWTSAAKPISSAAPFLVFDVFCFFMSPCVG